MGRRLTPDERVACASDDAIALAIDSIHDTALQNALLRRSQPACPLVEPTKPVTKTALLAMVRHCSPHEQEKYLLRILHETFDAGERNEAALALLDMKSSQVGAAAVQLVKDPVTKGHRGTLLYVINCLKDKIDLKTLVGWLIENRDAIEVQYETILLIEANRFTYERQADVQHCIKLLQRAISTRMRGTEDYIAEAIAYLSNVVVRPL